MKLLQAAKRASVTYATMLQLKEKTAYIHKSNMCGRIPKARADPQIHIGEYSRLIDISIETSFNFIFKRDWHESMRYFILRMGTFTITTFFFFFLKRD